MLSIKTNISSDDRLHFLRALKADTMASVFLKPSSEENRIAAIYDENKLCGGMLLFGGEPPVYLFCFFYNVEYCTKHYEEQLTAAIATVWPEIFHKCSSEYRLCKSALYDVYFIKPKSNK